MTNAEIDSTTYAQLEEYCMERVGHLFTPYGCDRYLRRLVCALMDLNGEINFEDADLCCNITLSDNYTANVFHLTTLLVVRVNCAVTIHVDGEPQRVTFHMLDGWFPTSEDLDRLSGTVCHSH